MDFSDEFIDFAKTSPLDALFKIHDEIASMIERISQWDQDSFDELTAGTTFISSMVDAKLLMRHTDLPLVTGKMEDDCRSHLNYLRTFNDFYRIEATKERVVSLKSKFSAALGATFSYHFTDGDVSRIQELLNELRDLVSQSNDFDADHKSRLLKRLERLQSEIHKNVSDLDRFWGLIGDASVVLGKLGNGAKPIVDRVREIADIVWRTQSIAEQLPTGTPPPLLRDEKSE